MANQEATNLFVNELDEKVLECPVCFKRLNQPKTLACMHSFCLTCLEDWTNKSGKSICPICAESYTVPEGGLAKLVPNIVINNLLEYLEQIHVGGDGNKVCSCCEEISTLYCKDCIQYFCQTCIQHHKTISALKGHTILTMEELCELSPQERASLKPTLCEKHPMLPLKFYCNTCCEPICLECTIIDHNQLDGKHKLTGIGNAFETFKDTAANMKDKVEACTNDLTTAQAAMTQNAEQLEKNYQLCEEKIDKRIEEIVDMIKTDGESLKTELKDVYNIKKTLIGSQLKELGSMLDNVTGKWNLIQTLAKSPDEAAALLSTRKLVKSLEEKLQNVPSIEPVDDGVVEFIQYDEFKAKLHKNNIGMISRKLVSDLLVLKKDDAELQVTDGQKFSIIAENTSAKCKLKNDENLKAILRSPVDARVSGRMNHFFDGFYKVDCRCKLPGEWQFSVQIDGVHIKNSPTKIFVRNQGLVHTINNIHDYKKDRKDSKITDILGTGDGGFLVASYSRELLKFNERFEFTGTFEFDKNTRVNRMDRTDDDDVFIYSDLGNKCVTVCKGNGEIIRHLAQGKFTYPRGVSLNEQKRVVYCADSLANIVVILDYDDGEILGKFGSEGNEPDNLINPEDLVVNKAGNVIVTDYGNDCLKLFDHNGKFLKILIGSGEEDGFVCGPHGIVLDNDGHILVSSNQKVQMFDDEGAFIKRIDKDDDGLYPPVGLSVISYRPRRVAVANQQPNNVKIFNY